MAGNGIQITLVCEDEAHYSLATFLADKVILREALQRGASWLDDDTLDWCRSFRGPPDTDARYYSMSRALQEAQDLGNTIAIAGRPGQPGRPIKLRGHIDGKPLQPEAGFWRRVLLRFAAEQPPPDLVLICKDTDGDLNALSGLFQAIGLLADAVPVIVAAPHQDAEGWFVAGFDPESEGERVRHYACQLALGFDPCTKPHRLTAHPNHVVTDAKRVLQRLAFDRDISRPPAPAELPLLCERTLSDLSRLEACGRECGLSAFLVALRTVLVPLLIPGSS